MAKGSAALDCRAPIPRPETPVIRAEYRGGNWPNTRNPAGGADGVWVGSVGGDATKAREWTAGIGGACCPTRVNHLVARRRERFRGGGTRYRIRFRAEREGHSGRRRVLHGVGCPTSIVLRCRGTPPFGEL